MAWQAGMAAAGCLVKEYWKEATCPICLEYFTDPVMTECGHNFCRACLTQAWKGLGRNVSCPECRLTIQPSSLWPNRKLVSIVEITKKFSLQEAGGVCKKHQEPLRLFCKDDEALICVVCDLSKEHREHQVILVEEAAEEYKERIWAQLQSLKEGREKFVEQKVVEEQRSQECLKQLEEEKQEITSIFKNMHGFLEEKEHTWLMELADLEAEITKMRERNINRLRENISYLSCLIEDVEGKCQQPPSEFLQEFRGTLSWCQEEVQSQRRAQSKWFEWRLRSSSLKISILENAKEKLEESMKQATSKDAGLCICNPEDHHTEEDWAHYIISVVTCLLNAKPIQFFIGLYALYVFFIAFLS